MSEWRPSPALRERVLAAAARAPAATRADHRRRTVILASIGLVVSAALFFGTGGFERGDRPTELVAFTSGLGLLAALVLTVGAFGTPRSMLGRPRSVLLAACLALAPSLAASVVVAAVVWPAHAREIVPLDIDVGCGVLTVVEGLVPLAFLLAHGRGSDPVHPAMTGAFLGTIAGAWTATMASLRCPHATIVHGLDAHVLPTLTLSVAGAVLGAMLLGVRRLSSSDAEP